MGSNSLLIRAKLPKVSETTESQVENDHERLTGLVWDMLISKSRCHV
jgi:hypothetical protein